MPLMALQPGCNMCDEQFLSDGLIYDVLSRVDAVTLAKASCASSEFRSVCADETVWEKLCNSRWPATKGASVKKIVSCNGGFKKLYADCYPCISGKGPAIKEDSTKSSRTLWICADRFRKNELSPSDFISIVDVVYKGASVLSRVIEGIAGAEGLQSWFANSPFRIDLLETPAEVVGLLKEEMDRSAVTFPTELPVIASVEKERKEGKFWKALCDDMRISWILINKKTRRMVNLASWKPLGGLRHWPCDDDFVLRFGTILPGGRDVAKHPIYCNIAMHCTYANSGIGEGGKTTLSLTELSMQLVDVDGVELCGTDAVATLFQVSGCRKTTSHSVVLESYHDFWRARRARKEVKSRQVGRPKTFVGLISGVVAFLSICYVLLKCNELFS